MELRDIVQALAKHPGNVSGPALAEERGWDWQVCKRIMVVNEGLIHMTKTEPPMVGLTPVGRTAAGGH